MLQTSGIGSARPRTTRRWPVLIGGLVLALWAALCGLAPDQPSAAWAQRAKAGKATVGSIDAALPAVRNGLAIPEPLKPWVGWVLHGEEQVLCPFLHDRDGDEDRRCAWPSRLQLVLTEKGGRFTQSWRLYRREWVTLPGSRKAWPQDVRVDGKPAVVASPDDDGDPQAMRDDEDSEDGPAPKVRLLPGDHTVSGTFLWDELPEALQVPSSTALLSLNLRGAVVAFPSRDAQGRLWLQRQANPEEEDVLDMTAHRRVNDEIPLLLTTRLELRVSGKSREVLLGRVLPDGFIAVSLVSPLPARLEASGRLRVQVRPGTHVLTVLARHEGPVNDLKRPDPGGPWPDGEVWVFEAQPALRQVTVEGVPAIDPQQTTLPEDWKRLPCYPVGKNDTLRLVEQHRGDAERLPDQLDLSREMWLDFDGSGYTVSDSITGTLSRTWRLEVNPPTELGRVAMDGKDLFITRSTQDGVDRAGVELRQGRVNLTADSRLQGHFGQVPAVSWNIDFHKVQTQLNLPPGWRLFHITGADEAPGTWLRHWTLLDLFLVLLIALAVGRLFGVTWGGLALLGLVLSLPEQNSPRWVWLGVLAVEALSRVLPESAVRLRPLLRGVRVASLVALTLALVSFAAQQVRIGLHPALERQDSPLEDEDTWMQRQSAVSNNVNLMPMTKNAPQGPPQVQAQASVFNNDSALGKDADEALGGLIGTGTGGGGAANVDAPEPMKRMIKSKAKLDEKEAQSYGKKGASWNSNNQRRMYQKEYDPNAMVQTGPGLPRWRWNRAVLQFSGSVERAQKLRLYLIPPTANLILLLGQVALLLLLALRISGLLGRIGSLWRGDLPPGAGALRSGPLALGLILLATLSSSTTARAELPSKELLDTLHDRLLQKPTCHPTCASSSRLQLEIKRNFLRMRFEVGAAADTAVPLPGSADQWLPEQVFLDGKPANAVARMDDGHLWLAVEEGSHQVILEGRLPSRETVQIALPLKSSRVEAKAEGWRLDGLHEDGIADDNLQLSRKGSGAAKAKAEDEDSEDGEGGDADAASPDEGSSDNGALQSGALPPFVRVEREVSIGLDWAVDTRVVRLGPSQSAVVLEVPLLPGESVTSSEIRVQGGKALINMGPGVSEVTWKALLQEKPQIELQASRGLPWTEVWRLSVSPIWHVEWSGIPVVHQQDSSGQHQPEWRPWPGEAVRIVISRPEGIAGRTLTIDHSELTLSPGLRATDATLNVRCRSSRGGQHTFTLPPGAVLTSVSIDGKTQPLRLSDRKLTVPLLPGSQRVLIKWREPRGIGLRYVSPDVELGAPSVNAEIHLSLGNGRWILLCGGPRLGPAVLFWSLLAVVLLTALGLGRVRFTPLRTLHWVLLGIGLTQVPVQASAIFVGWLLILGWRAKRPDLPRVWFNLRQLLLVAWSVAALIVLVSAIHGGLLGRPEMQIAGNGSYDHHLKWFSDRVADGNGALAHAWVVSVPIEVYRLAMLLWALWIASAMLRWLRWGYEALTEGGLWIKAPPKPPKPVKKPKKPSRDAKADEDSDDAQDEGAEASTASDAGQAQVGPAADPPKSASTPILPAAAPPTGPAPSASGAPASSGPQDKPEPASPSANTPILPRDSSS